MFRQPRLSPPTGALSLLDELSRYFLSGLVEDRVNWLAQREGREGRPISTIRHDKPTIARAAQRVVTNLATGGVR